jgi:hypothetical protein
MTAEVQAEIDAAFAVQLGRACGEAVGAQLIKHGHQHPSYPLGVVQTDSKSVVLTTGAPQLGLSVGPFVGWAWRVTRLSIVGATGGTYAVYRDKGLGLQDLIVPPGAATWAPNGTYEPSRLWIRYPYAFNAVGSSVTGAGLLIVDYLNVREDWLADAAT